jgi:hypothetical protein
MKEMSMETTTVRAKHLDSERGKSKVSVMDSTTG